MNKSCLVLLHFFFWVLFACLCVPSAAYALPSKQVEKYLVELDSIVANHKVYEKHFEEGLTRLKDELQNASDLDSIYQINQMLGIMYSSFIADSALYYLQINEEYARSMQRDDYLNEIHLGRARLYTSIGLLEEAQNEINLIDLTDMSDGFINNYYAIRLHMVIQKNRYRGLSVDDTETADLAEGLKEHTIPDHKLSHALQVLWNYKGPDRAQKLIGAYEPLLEESMRNQDLHAVHAAYMLSGAYAGIGNDELAVKNLALAAGLAVKLCDRELSPLTDLITFLVKHEDYERAYSYMHFVIESQTYYPDHARAMQIAQYMQLLSGEMLRISQQKQQTILHYLWGLTMAFVILAIMLACIFFMYRRMRRQKEEIALINKRLTESNNHILQINQQLNEANSIKEAYIASLFSNCSNYLNVMDEFRSDIYRKAKAGLMADVLQATAPENAIIHQESKELNRSFDETFLRIYPHFVNDLNKMLNEDGQLSAKEGSLTTELRIYALIWLGFSNGNKIANLLHITPKTVYNAIARVRSKARIPNVTAEQFNADVCALGRHYG